MDWFYKINLLEGWLPTTLKILTLLGFIAVIVLKSKDGWFSPLLKQFGWGFIGTVIGYMVVWLLSDVFMVFGVSLGRVIEFNIAFGIGFIAVLVSMCFDSGTLRKTLAIITAVLTLLTFALRVDIIYGEFSTVGSLFGHNQFSALEAENVHKASATQTDTVKEWRKLGEENKLPAMPKKGIVRSVNIPATLSHFKARTANVYLPPAALSKNPPRLPVMIVMAGQPGTPDRFFSAGVLGDKLDSYAAKHYGLAPIAVSPDQNGSITHNSLCADTPVFGNAETYLTRDVNNWIKKTLPVETSPDKWLIGGYSQGGTCATQLGAAHPDLYGHIYSAGGEIEPTAGSHRSTVKRFFNGSEKEFDKHVPITLIRNHAPSKQTWFSAAGELDSKSQRNQKAISAQAMKAGMSVTTVIVKGTAHDWHTVNAGMTAQIDLFGTETGLGKTGRQISSYPNLQVVSANTNRESD
ncbi:alpha/beta hydrolase-fold protein [Bifidobacterium sp. ESL0798]|uniref:alpha/beta hydrolase n=1 Tax=Bifidobacterium sp. ESL0798 TaxID=2983235 RepID=UPI0023F9D240|nr:alpha/beta hydrolase-fold protein [Bifidobacterium sp. ESL0798]WEV73441.1 alpha/beta hydrolase-fold protein [Bifidobacterium sp. ESL0798]